MNETSANQATPLLHVETFTKGKNPNRNEDYIGHNTATVVLSDGATDKTGIRYDDKGADDFKTGGEIASRLAVDVALRSDASGQELIEQITTAAQDFYKVHNPEALTNSALRFATTLVAAQVVDDELIVTQVGDSSFRINATDTYTNDKAIDSELSAIRAHYIEETGDIDGARAQIMPRLKTQHTLQNNDLETLGYGAIDGVTIPAKFIKTYRFPLQTIQTIEIVSDGYFGAFPDSATIDGYEQLHQHIEQVDPFKSKQYPSTKVSDDRTVMIVSFT